MDISNIETLAVVGAGTMGILLFVVLKLDVVGLHLLLMDGVKR